MQSDLVIKFEPEGEGEEGVRIRPFKMTLASDGKVDFHCGSSKYGNDEYGLTVDIDDAGPLLTVFVRALKELQRKRAGKSPKVNVGELLRSFDGLFPPEYFVKRSEPAPSEVQRLKAWIRAMARSSDQWVVRNAAEMALRGAVYEG